MKLKNALITIKKLSKLRKFEDLFLYQDTVKDIINSVNDNQLKCKKWLIENLKSVINLKSNPKICVAAGWYCTLGLDLRKLTDNTITSFDKNPLCKDVGKIFNSKSNINFEVKDIIDFDCKDYDVIICTSCEHISQQNINKFLINKKKDSIVVLQSNNYKKISQHINCKNTVDEFLSEYSYTKLLYKGSLDLKKYNRHMVIFT